MENKILQIPLCLIAHYLVVFARKKAQKGCEHQ